MAANQLPQDPALREAFEKFLNATEDAGNAEHARLDRIAKTHVAANSRELTSTLNIFDAATKKLSEIMDQKRVSSPSPATLFSQSAEHKNPSSVEANNSTTPGPSNS